MPMELPKTGYGRTYPIVIVPYDPAWPERFTREAARIGDALGDVALRIEHVGSTAVPGLGAKPVIDIQVSVGAMEPVDRYRLPLERLGYGFVHDPDHLDHEFFHREVEGVRAFQIHVCPLGSEWEGKHLAFRDHLRAHPEDAARYEALKRHLAARFSMDMGAYLAGKDAWIGALEERTASEGGRA